MGRDNLLRLGISASEGFLEEEISELGLVSTQYGRASLAKAGTVICGLVKGAPYSLSWFGPDSLRFGLSFAVGLQCQEGQSIFSPDEFAQGCGFRTE